MRRESIFDQIERHLAAEAFVEERHKKHMASGKRRPQTCFQCRLGEALECAEYALAHPDSDQQFALDAVRTALSDTWRSEQQKRRN
jgi:hypothetical protein